MRAKARRCVRLGWACNRASMAATPSPVSMAVELATARWIALRLGSLRGRGTDMGDGACDGKVILPRDLRCWAGLDAVIRERLGVMGYAV